MNVAKCARCGKSEKYDRVFPSTWFALTVHGTPNRNFAYCAACAPIIEAVLSRSEPLTI